MSVYLSWLTVGLALIILEFIVPGTYLVWFGFSALVMGGLTFFVGTLGWMAQMVTFCILSVVFAVIGWKLYGKLIFKSGVPTAYRNLNDPVAQHVGKVVPVTDVRGDKLQIAIGDTVWAAVSTDKIQKGDKVQIIGSDNNVLLNVKKYLDKKNKIE